MAEETNLKVGDILICHTGVMMDNDAADVRTTVGKSYKIIKIIQEEPYTKYTKYKFAIENDDNCEHHFYFNNYTKWFYNVRELRRMKLKKIQKNSKC